MMSDDGERKVLTMSRRGCGETLEGFKGLTKSGACDARDSLTTSCKLEDRFERALTCSPGNSLT
jgi:hypothetical protein